MKVSFEEVAAREVILKQDSLSSGKDRKGFSRSCYALGKDWARLGDFKKAKEYFWQSFVSWPLRISGLLKIVRVNVKKGDLGYNALRRNWHLRRILGGQRVLIIGSGRSAATLERIPPDVKVLTCNVGPRILLDKGIDRTIDVYYLCGGALEGGHRDENVIDLLSRSKIALFIGLRRELNDLKSLRHRWAAWVQDYAFNDSYMRTLLGPQRAEKIKLNRAGNNRTSSGIRLLQYALYSRAREIYLSGIDLGEGGYFWGRDNIHRHTHIDKNFLEVVSCEHGNIFAASQDSPVARYVPYKPLRG